MVDLLYIPSLSLNISRLISKYFTYLECISHNVCEHIISVSILPMYLNSCVLTINCIHSLLLLYSLIGNFSVVNASNLVTSNITIRKNIQMFFCTRISTCFCRTTQFPIPLQPFIFGAWVLCVFQLPVQV